jgi:hypothetical protein
MLDLSYWLIVEGVEESQKERVTSRRINEYKFEVGYSMIRFINK